MSPQQTVSEAISHCATCSLPLPLRRVRPGEVGASWVCMWCGGRVFGVFDSELNPSAIGNVTPAEDVNPRVLMEDELVETMYRRADRHGRVFDERHSNRRASHNDVMVLLPGRDLPARLEDLGPGGVGFVTGEALAPETLIDVRFDRSVGRPVRRCVVRACQALSEGEFRIGAEFTS